MATVAQLSLPGDGVHPSANGAVAIANVLADLDYEPAASKKQGVLLARAEVNDDYCGNIYLLAGVHITSALVSKKHHTPIDRTGSYCNLPERD